MLAIVALLLPLFFDEFMDDELIEEDSKEEEEGTLAIWRRRFVLEMGLLEGKEVLFTMVGSEDAFFNRPGE